MSAWPSLLPNPTGSFSGSNSATTVAVTMESGRVRQQRRFTAELRLFNATWDLDDYQFGMFQSFVLHKLNNGADYFTVDLPVGAGYQMVSARIVSGEYNAEVHGITPHWNVTAQLEVIDALVATP